MTGNLYRFGFDWCLNTGLRATYWRTAKDARMWAETQKLKVRRTRHLDVSLI
jgi:hypothetical protein